MPGLSGYLFTLGTWLLGSNDKREGEAGTKSIRAGGRGLSA